MNRIITLTTDFGTPDGYAVAVKGVILSINPQALIVDVTHQIPAQNIMAGAFCLFNFYSFFPEGTIHLAVVDPGVGAHRKSVLIQTERYFFVGPDNGIFHLALQKERVKKIIHLTNSKYFLAEISPTFHGRDVFAPVAAYLSRGVKPEEFGPRISELERLNFPPAKMYTEKIVGQIIHIDIFGNLVSNITRPQLKRRKISRIMVRNRIISKLSNTFSEVKRGELVAYPGSSGFLEVGVNQGSVAQSLKAKIGDKIEIRL